MFKTAIIVIIILLLVLVAVYIYFKKDENSGLKSHSDYLKIQNEVVELNIKAKTAELSEINSELNRINREIAEKDLALKNARDNLYSQTEEMKVKCVTQLLKEKNVLEDSIQELKKTQDIIIEKFRKQEEEEIEYLFYMLQVPEESLRDIKLLQEVQEKLIQSEAIGKVIWKVYFEKLYTSLVGRVVGNSIKTGIYKITNIQNNKCYIGQAVNISSRWKQHIKRGVGAEVATNNKLYPAFKAEGLENFTFEILEECTKANLGTREKY